MTTSNSSAALDTQTNKSPEDDQLLKIKRLKTKLINEEHRLVLMKKIRQSQTRPINTQQQQQPKNQQQLQGLNNSSNTNNITNTTNNSINHYSQHANRQLINSQTAQPKRLRPSQTGQPLALHRNQVSSGSMINQLPNALSLNSSTFSSNMSPSLNQTPAHAHQRSKVNSLWNPPPQQARHPPPVGIAPPHVGNISRQPITTPPNVVQAMMGSLAGQQSLLINQINAATRRSSQQQPQQSHFQPSSSSLIKSQAAQMLLQQNKRQPNFKPSIQKQIEQTLMQQQQQQKHGTLPGFSPSPNISNKRTAGISSPHVGNLSRQPITTPPNVVQDMRGGLQTGQQSLLMNANNLTNSRRSQQPLSQQQQQLPFNKSQAAQMLLQKRTAAKSAIQKQLEQTLIQLPQKQIQLGIDFLPNANNIEFVYYIGLEACVDYLTETTNPIDPQPLEKPYECSTCGTDFTPSWSWKRSQAVCENCVSNHVKKSIKNTQANRIKSVLAKAAKQEHEMDQRIMAEAANVVSTPSTTSSTNQQHSLLQPASHQQRSSSSQVWPRVNASPLSSSPNTRTSTSLTTAPIPAPNVQTAINANPLASLQPAALASLLQMNPQFGTLASLMTANNNNTNNNTNQLAQVAALLMNQLTMNLWKR